MYILGRESVQPVVAMGTVLAGSSEGSHCSHPSQLGMDIYFIDSELLCQSLSLLEHSHRVPSLSMKHFSWFLQVLFPLSVIWQYWLWLFCLLSGRPPAVSEWNQHDPAVLGDFKHLRQVIVETGSLISVMSWLLGKYLQMSHPPSW